MRRKMTDTLLAWKKEPRKCPFVLTGTRQAGKTWILQDFGKRIYQRTAYFHLAADIRLRSYFHQEKNPAHLLEFLEVHGQVPIHRKDTLVILDEIQACPEARAALNVFSDEFPGYSIAAAERMPGTAGCSRLASAEVQTGWLTPLDFEEFLWACREVSLAKEIREHFQDGMPMEKDRHLQAMRLLRAYLIVGGMPAAVQKYREEHSFLEMADIHSKILQLDRNDIMENASKEERTGICACYRSIPDQLQKENPCFQYSIAQKGSTRKQMDRGILWMEKEGLVFRLKEDSANPGPNFKLYLRDTGLCATGMGIPAASILQGDSSLSVKRLVENYLASTFLTNDYALSYWHSGNTATIPFILEKSGKRIAVDLHFNQRKKARSLFEYQKQRSEDMAYRISGKNFKREDYFYQIPYYAAFCI